MLDAPQAANYDALASRLIIALGADHVLRGEPCASYMIDGLRPAIVARPASPEGVAAALHLAAEAGMVVVPWGGGTQMALGYPVARLDLALSLERLNHVRQHDPDRLTATVEAGCTVAALEDALAATGQQVALDGPLAAQSTIGGRIATGTSGLRRGVLGSVRDLVVGLSVARTDGTIMRTGGEVIRYVVGYDLNKIFVGTLGTLGIIVEATLRLTPAPESEGTVISAFSDASFIWPLLSDLRAIPLLPRALSIAGPGLLGATHGLTDAIADQLHPASQSLLLVRLGGAQESVQRAALAVRQVALKNGASAIVMLRDDAMRAVWQTLDDLPATHDLPACEAVLKVGALPSEVGKVVEMARGFAQEHDLRHCWLADALTGSTWLRLIGEGAAPEQFAAALVALQESLAWRWRNAVVLGCSPAIRQRLPLWGADQQGLELMRAIKSHFDPMGILNPGRFVGQS